MPELGKHRCPRRTCKLVVSDRLFCCYNDWYALSSRARTAIGATANLSLLAAERRAAVQMSVTEWERIDAKTGSTNRAVR